MWGKTDVQTQLALMVKLHVLDDATLAIDTQKPATYRIDVFGAGNRLHESFWCFVLPMRRCP